MDGYNGWRNRETWLINVWFGDNWETPEDVDCTKEYFEEEMSQIPSFLQDFIYDCSIDWDELREHVQRDMDAEEEYQNSL